VRLRWITAGDTLGQPDAVILPGSKQTLRDLQAIRESGLEPQLLHYCASGGSLLGICGGMQLLGMQLEDPSELEGGAGIGPFTGLGLLPLETCFGDGSKALRQRTVTAQWPFSTTISGFELHHGSTKASPTLQPLADDAEIGWWQPTQAGGHVIGTYLHGLLDNGPWRRQWLNELRTRKGLPALSLDQAHHREHRDQLLDRLADAFEQHVDLTPLLT